MAAQETEFQVAALREAMWPVLFQAPYPIPAFSFANIHIHVFTTSILYLLYRSVNRFLNDFLKKIYFLKRMFCKILHGKELKEFSPAGAKRGICNREP
jgi:hypothetical protein